MIDFKEWGRLRNGWSKNEYEWVFGFYFDPNSGNGDFFYNTCRKLIEEGIKDEETLEAVFYWLDQGKRWPDWADEMVTTSNHTQTQMTQDPWVLAYCCAVHMGRLDLIEKYRPPFWMFMPDKWAWRRALLGKPNAYWLWRRITPYRWMHSWVYVYYGFMERAYLSA